MIVIKIYLIIIMLLSLIMLFKKDFNCVHNTNLKYMLVLILIVDTLFVLFA